MDRFHKNERKHIEICKNKTDTVQKNLNTKRISIQCDVRM